MERAYTSIFIRMGANIGAINAIVTGRADKNIAEDLKGMIKPKPQGHYAAIEAKDLPQFMTDLREHKAKLNRQTYLAVNFMMLTFVRTGEMIRAQWNEFDLEEKTWLSQDAASMFASKDFSSSLVTKSGM